MIDEFHALWLSARKGITRETAEAFGLHSNGDMLVIPYRTGEKMRTVDDTGDRTFRFTPGKAPHFFPSPGAKDCKVIFLVEGETDTMRLWQALQEDGRESGVIGIPGIHTWRDEWAQEIPAERIYVVLDNDDDYKVRAQVDELWGKIRQQFGSRAVRVQLPSDVKDICEFFDSYTLSGLETICKDARAGRIHYKALDLAAPAPPPDWIVGGLIARGDIVLLIGEPGAGKSFLAMDLATAVADRHTSWLGFPLSVSTGRVLYIDQENPLDVVYGRLNSLGLSNDGKRSIRYLHYQGVRLDRRPDKILDESLNWSPDLIVFDSLTRFHTRSENDAGEMSGVFNDGVAPLARFGGAAVVLLHHVTKEDTNNSFRKARGSTDLSAVLDTGLELRAQGNGLLHLIQYKSRRGRSGKYYPVSIEDIADGGIAVKRLSNDRLPF